MKSVRILTAVIAMSASVSFAAWQPDPTRTMTGEQYTKVLQSTTNAAPIYYTHTGKSDLNYMFDTEVGGKGYENSYAMFGTSYKNNQPIKILSVKTPVSMRQIESIGNSIYAASSYAAVVSVNGKDISFVLHTHEDSYSQSSAIGGFSNYYLSLIPITGKGYDYIVSAMHKSSDVVEFKNIRILNDSKSEVVGRLGDFSLNAKGFSKEYNRIGKLPAYKSKAHQTFNNAL